MVPLHYNEGVNSFTINLMSDASGHPGNILESFLVTGVPPYPGSAIETGTSIINTPLNAGTTYWIAVMPNDRTTAGGWIMNPTGAMGWSMTENDGVTWDAKTGPSPALEVNGVLVNSVPEPSTIGVLGIGLVTLGVWRRARLAKRVRTPEDTRNR
jgi:hypothetical protein